MGELINPRTPHMRWRQTSEPYKPNVEVSRDYWTSVTVTVSSNGYGSRRELTPAEAREMAAALTDLANLAEAAAEHEPHSISTTKEES